MSTAAAVNSNRFGFAVQLCLLRFPGWTPKRRDRVPLKLLQYVGEQLQIETDNIEEYFRRQPTRSEHLQEIMDFYGFRSYDREIGEEIAIWMKAQAHHWHTPIGLLLSLLEELRRKRVILPAMSLLEHTAWRIHQQVEQEAPAKLSDSLRPLQRSELDDLLMPAIDPEDRTLTWLRRPIRSAGSKGMLDLMDRLELVCTPELSPSLAEGVNPLLLRQLAGRGARHTLQHLREYNPQKRFGILVAFPLHNAPSLTDELIDMFIRLVGQWFNKADKRRWELLQNNGRNIDRRLHDFIVRTRTDRGPREEVGSLRSYRIDLRLGGTYGRRDGKTRSTSGFQQPGRVVVSIFARPAICSSFLICSGFQGNSTQAFPSIIKAVESLRSLNHHQHSAVPKDAPREFVPRRWRPYVFDGEKIDRAYYELCVLSELSLALRSGDMWVPGSRRYLPLDDYLLSPEVWKTLPRSRSSVTCSEYLDERQTQLHDGFKKVSQLLAEGQLPDISMQDGALSISPLKADVPEQGDLWSDRIYDLLPRIYLTDLLMEVDSWTAISNHFTHLYNQQPAVDRTMVFSVILSDATNIGLTKIADATPGRSYARLSWVADRYVREENYAKALAEIVRKQHQVPLASRWGPGTTSSSDGQPFL